MLLIKFESIIGNITMSFMDGVKNEVFSDGK